MRLELLARLSIPASLATTQGAEHREHLESTGGVPEEKTRKASNGVGFQLPEHLEHREHRKTDDSVIDRAQLSEDIREDFEERAAVTEYTNLDALLAEACQGVEGIDAATYRALLSPADLEDIEGGFIPMVTLNAYAKSFAEGIRCGRITVLAAAMPKPALPERVRCNGCRHFERDTIGDGAGIGRCVIGGEGTGSRHPALWANAERECKDFEAR